MSKSQPNWRGTRGKVQWLNEYRLTIGGDEDQDLVASVEV